MNELEVKHFESLYPELSRYDELEKTISFIKQGRSVQIVGLPGVGQSTILKLLAYNRKVRLKHLGDDLDKYHFTLINFSEVKKRSLYEVTKFIFLCFIDSLRERGMQAEFEMLNKLFKESILLKDELVLFQGLKQALDVLMLDKNISVVFLFDRFEEYVPMLTSDFFNNLSVIRNRAKHKFSVVIALSRPLNEIIDNTLIDDFKESLAENIVYLSLSDENILKFRTQKVEEVYGRKLDISTKDLILKLTGSFGRLTKNCIQYALNQSLSMLPESLDETIRLLLSQQSIQAPLMDIWQTLTPSEQDFLLSNLEYSSSDDDYPYLSHVGLLKEGEITIPLFKIYLQSSIKEFEKKTEKEPIEFIKETNEIRQGADIISDKLTRSEFKLLKLLIEKQNLIIDRESIINAVWSDAASTAGVTDQALDQLLLRLRRKIEEDPNKPIHIGTVKGRGVRFIP